MSTTITEVKELAEEIERARSDLNGLLNKAHDLDITIEISHSKSRHPLNVRLLVDLTTFDS